MKKQYETIVISVYHLELADIITVSSGEGYGDGVPAATSGAFRGEEDILGTKV